MSGTRGMRSSDTSTTTRWRVIGFAALLVGFFIAHYNWRSPVLRFDAPLANRLFLLGAFALPTVALPIGWCAARGRARVALGALMLPLLLCTWASGVLFAFDLLSHASDLARGQNGAFDPIRRLDLGASRLVLYRTNCGATCAWGLVLRQERALAPGISIVREVGSWHRAYDAVLAPQVGGACTCGCHRIRPMMPLRLGTGPSLPCRGSTSECCAA